MKTRRSISLSLLLLLSSPVAIVASAVEQPQQTAASQQSQLASLLAQLHEIAAAAGVALPEALTSLISGSWNPEDAQQQFEAAAAALEQLASQEALTESAAALVADLKLVLEQTFAQLVAYKDEDEQEPTSKKAREVFCNVFIKNLLNVCGNLFVNGKVTINSRNGDTNQILLQVNGDTNIAGDLTVNNITILQDFIEDNGIFNDIVVNNTITVNSFDAGVVQSDANGLLFSSTNITEAEQLSLPATTSNTVGVINIDGTPAFHAFGGPTNIFVGSDAGNFTLTGLNNTALGNNALSSNTTGGNNTAVGVNAATATTGSRNVAMGDSALAVNAAGNDNVAIGFQAGTSSAAVSGTVAIGSNALQLNTAANNVAVGFEALQANVTGTNNTAVGYQALDQNTVSNNTALGYQALTANTTGAGNTAVGASALDANTTGSNNTATGLNALGANTNGIGNTAVGANALDANEGGINNVAVGLNALGANTVGSTNVALGRNALAANATGSDNVAVGDSAAAAYDGTGIVAIGSGALLNNTAVQNTAVGTNTLRANIVGIENTAVGFNSLPLCVGSSNTALGNEVLESLLTGNNNIAIGSNAGSAYAGAESNNIIIGGQVTGTLGESDTIRIGNPVNATGQNFQAGIAGVSLGVAGQAVFVNPANGQLGQTTSSRRFKENIKSLDTELTQKMMQLRPVEYNYIADEQKLQDWGLIAEEVVEILPRLVVMDKDGQPLTVRYHILPAMLLHMIQQQQKQIDELRSQIAQA